MNIESTDPAIDLDDLSFEFSLDLSKLSQLDTIGVSTDTGGVAGYSSGAISECVNEAAIGYQHIGYNVGGIVGRSSGQVRSCTNSGAVCGRKDVGGIAGQMEPYVRTEVSASQFSVMKSQLDELSRLVEKAVNDAQYSTGEICDRLSLISGYLSDASDAAGDVRVNVDLDAITPPSIDIDGGIIIGPHPGISDVVSVTNFNTVVGAITAAGSQLSLITENVKTSSTTLSSDLRSINSKFNELSKIEISLDPDYAQRLLDMQIGVRRVIIDTSRFLCILHGEDVTISTLCKVQRSMKCWEEAMSEMFVDEFSEWTVEHPESNNQIGA